MSLPPFRERLFPIQGCLDFRTGVCPDGTQVMMGLLCPHVVCLFFAPDGSFLRVEERDLVVPFWHTPSAVFQPAFEKQMRQWQDEIGYTPAPIRIRYFFSEPHSIGISDGLDMFEDYEGIDEEERLYNSESREGWVESGCFVFWWAKDYHMSAVGEVMST